MRTKKIMNLVCLFNFLLCSAGIFAQSTVTGTVTDDNSLPILGATVQVKGTSNGVVTDENGTYSIQASQGDVLVFSYIGFGRKQMAVSGSTVNVQLREDVSILNEVIVSSTRKPIRVLQATTAVNRIGTVELENIKPETFSEALQNTPGVTINESQGRKGGFSIRGFPGGNVYTTTLLDGLPTSGTSNLSSGTQEYYSYDSTVERIEVVRGAAATLFGRASAAGAVNIISKTGGKEHAGSVSFTKYNNVSNEGHQFDGDLDYRADWNFNGPINEKLRYNIGGFVINDSGQKEQAFKDTGGQIRANFDWLISEGSKIRVSAGYSNLSYNNNTDTPYDLNAEAPAAGFLNSSTYHNDYRQLFGPLPLTGANGSDIRVDQNGDPIVRNPADFKELTIGGYIGIDATFDLGSGWSVNHKSRAQKFDWNDINDIAFSNFYDADASLFRFLGRSEQDVNDLVTETRFSKFIEGANATHNLSAGLFYSTGKRDRLGTNVFYSANVSPRPELGFFFGERIRTSATTSHREEKSTGLFIGDEMVFNEKLSVNAAFRYDWFNAKFNDDPEEIRSSGTDAGINNNDGVLIEFDEDFSDYSFSVGANYLLGESSAIYANYLRAFSLTSVTTRTFVRPDGNEVVDNLEIGARAGFGDLTIDATIFNTKIDNRVALFLNNATQEFEPTAAGTNKILGAEIALTYAPKAIKGLLVRGNVTLQQSEYDNFQIQVGSGVDIDGDLFGLDVITTDGANAIDIAGNQVEQTPSTIYNLNIGYSKDRWGVDFGGFTYAGRFADATNLYEIPNLSIYNLGAYVTFPLGTNELKLSLRVKNIFDGNNPQSLFASTRDDSALAEKQANPTSIPNDRFAWAIIQNPKRVLFTVGYKF